MHEGEVERQWGGGGQCRLGWGRARGCVGFPIVPHSSGSACQCHLGAGLLLEEGTVFPQPGALGAQPNGVLRALAFVLALTCVDSWRFTIPSKLLAFKRREHTSIAHPRGCALTRVH